MTFKQNMEMTYHPSREVERNRFLTKPVGKSSLPRFKDIKDRLPVPIWENHQDTIDCYWKAWKLAFGNLCQPREGTGFVSPFIDTAFNGCIFMWDSAFMMMFGKYADKLFHFQGTLDNFYSHQHKDGYICREIEEETGFEHFSRYDPSATGPEVLPWCEWDYFCQFGDRERLRDVFPPLIAYHRWMAEHHTWPDGTYFSSGWGCGMDNVPRLMPGYDVKFSHGHMIWVDACMQSLQSCKILKQMAQELGENAYIEELSREEELLEQVINGKLWDEQTGFYYDLWKDGRLNEVMHIGAYWALLAGCAPEQRAQRLVERLEDPETFKTPHRVPTLARNHPEYCPQGEYWRGSVWAPTNYMVLKGLDRYNRYDLAHEIAAEHVNAVTETFKRRGTLFENYAPECADKGNIAKPDFVGWTGLVPISVLFEYVFGIKPNAQAGRILWDIQLLEAHGVEKYPFGPEGELTLLCGKRENADEMPQITAESTIPVELEIIWGSRGNKQRKIIKL